MSEKTIALSGAETEVHFSGGNAWLRNDGASAVYAAKTAGVAAGADGVISIPAGCSAPVYGANGTVFLLGSGSVQLIGSDYATNPFVGDSFGGGADIVANAAEMVTLDNLQVGVPFSNITVSGKNLFDGALTVGMVSSTTGILINTDAGAKRYISTTNHISVEPKTTYTAQNSENKTIDTVVFFDSSKNVIGHMYTTAAGFNSFTTPDNCKFVRWRYLFDSVQSDTSVLTNIQLEVGDTATEYEPPIIGQEVTLTVNDTEYTVTPDSNPYTVSVDIRQQDGINNVSVSTGKVQVTGVKRNAAVKRIWDKLDELTAAIIVSNGETTE